MLALITGLFSYLIPFAPSSLKGEGEGNKKRGEASLGLSFL
jgi:hypothetical protein